MRQVQYTVVEDMTEPDSTNLNLADKNTIHAATAVGEVLPNLHSTQWLEGRKRASSIYKQAFMVGFYTALLLLFVITLLKYK